MRTRTFNFANQISILGFHTTLKRARNANHTHVGATKWVMYCFVAHCVAFSLNSFILQSVGKKGLAIMVNFIDAALRSPDSRSYSEVGNYLSPNCTRGMPTMEILQKPIYPSSVSHSTLVWNCCNTAMLSSQRSFVSKIFIKKEPWTTRLSRNWTSPSATAFATTDRRTPTLHWPTQPSRRSFSWQYQTG